MKIMSYQLRPYQQAAIDETISWFRANENGNPIMWLPTASGKSLLVAELCRLSLHGFKQQSRVLMIVPSKELAEQNLEKISSLIGQERIGVLSAAMGRKDCPTDFDVIVGTIGTVARVHPGNLGRIGLVIIDEAHLVPNKDTGMYRKLINGLKQFNATLRCVGLTATPFRGNGVWLHQGIDPLFSGISTRIKMKKLLNDGFLSPLVNQGTSLRVGSDDFRVDSKTGDFVLQDIADSMNRAEIIAEACNEIVSLGADRKKWMVFCVTIEHAKNIQNKLIGHGIAAALVTANSSKTERESLIAGFRSGRYRCIVNVAALTTGFDVPEVDFIALLRNTQSPVLYTQIAGRGMRIANGKQNCVWSDFTDSTLRLGPIDLIEGRDYRKTEAAEAIMKTCPECTTKIHAGFSKCPICGYDFPIEKIKHYSQAQAAPILQATKEPSDYEITSVLYRKHKKPGSPDSMRVDYQSGLRTVASEWICFEHEGYAKQKAIKWWRDRRNNRGSNELYPTPDNEAYPTSTEEAIRLANYPWALPVPKIIKVDESEKYPKITKFYWRESHD